MTRAMQSTTTNVVLAAAVGLLLLVVSQPCHAAASDEKGVPHHNLRRHNLRRLGLEMYQRYTPPPTPTPSNNNEEEEDTEAPTLPTASPTFEPTIAPTEAPTEPKQGGKDKDEDVDFATDPPSADDEDDIETVAPSAEFVEDEESVHIPSGDVSQGDLYSSSTEYSENSVGDVFVEFSLWSPTKSHMEMDFMKLKMGVCGSIDVLVCDASDPIVEQGPEYCAVRDDVLLKEAALPARDSVTGDIDATVLALASTNVNDASGVVHNSDLLQWTTWRMSWNVIQVGSTLFSHIETMYEVDGVTLTEDEKNRKGLALLQQMMAVEMERTLRQGVFQDDLNNFLDDGTFEVRSSVVGEEVSTFGSMMMPTQTTEAGDEVDNGDDKKGGGIMIVFFFAGLGVACFVIVTLLYFSFRSRIRVSRKRSVIIVDDTSKDCTDSQNSSQEHPREAEEQEQVFVIEHEQALQEEPLQQQLNHLQQEQNRWDEAANGADGDEESSVEGGDEDVESHRNGGQSTANTSMYTAGSGISAITGVSGLEHSDTWSVGSMSIDLAEWG